MAKPPKYITDPKTFNTEYQRLVDLKRVVTEAKQQIDVIAADINSVKGMPAQAKEDIKYLDGRKDRAKTLTAQIHTLSKDATTTSTAIGELNKKFEAVLEGSTTNAKTIAGLIDDAKKASDDTKKVQDRIDNLSKEIREQLGKAVGGGLATAFAKRAKRISVSKWWWFIVLIALTVAAPFIAVYVFTHVDATQFVGSNLIAINIFRLGTLSPLIFFISYASIQYSHERELQEKYEFKSSMAQSLPAYTKIMKDEFYDGDKAIAGHEEDLIKFAFDSINKIYKEPFNSTKVRQPLFQVNRSGSGQVINSQKDVISPDNTTMDTPATATAPKASK